MRFGWLVALAVCGCAAPLREQSATVASVPVLTLDSGAGAYVTDDLAMCFGGALVLPSPDGGSPIEVPRPRTTTVPALRPTPPFDLRPAPRGTSDLGSSLWKRRAARAPYKSGVQLYGSQQVKLLVGTRTLIDEWYADAVNTDPRHDPLDANTAAVVGLRLRF